MALGDGNCLICSSVDTDILLTTGFSSTIADSFNALSVSGGGDTSWDGSNIYTTYSTPKAVKNSGFSITVLDSHSTLTNPIAYNFTGTDSWVSNNSVAKTWGHAGFTSTIATSFATVGLYGLSQNGLSGDMYGAKGGTEQANEYSGFSGTITDSFVWNGVDTTMQGIGHDDTDLISSGDQADKIYKWSGFSSTLTDSATSLAWTDPRGIEWDAKTIYDPSAPTSTFTPQAIVF